MSKKILIVEDEPDIREALGAWLEDEGFEIAEATDGIDGLTEFKRFEPDLALLDMNMPGLSGIELCTVLRRITAVPLIMFTAAGDLDGVQEAIARGATDFVLKDTGFDELVVRISDHLKIERPRNGPSGDSSGDSGVETGSSTRVETAPGPDTKLAGHARESGLTEDPRTLDNPFADDLWTWGGSYFGFRDGQNLWTRDGRHVGRFRGDQVSGPNGQYLGELNNGRLIVDWHKAAWRANPFRPSDSRGGLRQFTDRERLDMLIGFKDFPAPDEV